MSSDDDWRAALTATERFTNIQKIEASGQKEAIAGSAFTLENEAYLSSTSRLTDQADYDAACLLLSHQDPGHDLVDAAASERAAENKDSSAAEKTEPGVAIGSYRDCRYIASGASSDVYRCDAVALKVITCGTDHAPHNPHREAQILKDLQKPCIPLLSTFYDDDQQLVLVFPFMPVTLDALLRDGAAIPRRRLLAYFADMFRALAHIHGQGIMHRDVKPSAVLLDAIDGPAYLSDFGTAWHPALSLADEPADQKILDVGTGPYRAPEVLFGHQSYGPAVDMWGAGAMLAECARPAPAQPLFESGAAHEDGNQLGLILSIFKTLGTPTPQTWPEAVSYKTPPFEMYRVFEPHTWPDILSDVDPDVRELVASLVKYDSSRLSAEQALSEIVKMQA